MTQLSLLENIAGIGVTSSGSSPSQQVLIDYLNQAQIQVARDARPSELFNPAPQSITTVQGTISYSVPEDLMTVTDVYYPIDDSDNYRQLQPKDINLMIDPMQYFKSNTTDNPSFVDVKGCKITLDKQSPVAGRTIKVFGHSYPTKILTSNLGNTSEFDEQYKMAIIYYAAFLYSLSDDNMANTNLYLQMFSKELGDSKVSGSSPWGKTASLNPKFWNYGRK